MAEFLNRVFSYLGPIRGLIERPYYWFLDAAAFEDSIWQVVIYDLLAVLLIFLALKWALGGAWRFFFPRNRLLERAEIDALVTKNTEHVRAIEAATSLQATLRPLKKARDWAQMGYVYESINQPKDAAKYYRKAKNYKKAGQQLAKAGLTLKAARMMMKAGEFDTAGRFFLEVRKHRLAGKAFEKDGNAAGAAEAYAQGGNYTLAFQRYVEYFQKAADPLPKQVKAAEACYALTRHEMAAPKLTPELRAALLPAVAAVFERGQRYDLAAPLYRQAGDPARAGEVYLLAGDLQEAAQCMKDAGKPKEAARIGARYYEKLGKFREAGHAYVAAAEYAKAGECFAKANEPVRAAECYMKAGAFYRAGLAYAHAGRFEDAVGALQKVPENDGSFAVSRGVLGRCFYELHDYARCAATLENHLIGTRVDSSTKEFYWMWALALEQLGELKKSRDLFLKIAAVDRAYRDVNSRISSIDSRISMLESGAGQEDIQPGPSRTDEKVMELVENSLGKRYELLKELGRGGMGVVYLARDRQLERQVALKFLGSLVDNSEEFRQRFIREARTAAKITHPNIVGIYDISASEGKAYIAMEYVEGVNLFRYIQKKGRLEPREAVNILVQTLNALQAIHDAGIVHRDIKPDNILIAKGGLVKLMDFGLAKAEGHRMTKSNVVMGTPCYMSPEQAMGKDVDGRADIYALGLVLHEALTGKIVFDDGDIMMRQVHEDPPRPGELVEGVPPALDDAVMKALAKDPDRRYQTAREFADALRQALKAVV